MIINKQDNKYRFKSLFDMDTGNYLRSGILDDNNHDTGVDPFMTSFPELIDIGIMGHCKHGLSGKCRDSGVQCYQHGDACMNPNMTLQNYKSIIDECKGKVFQVALGGCGDPDQHEDFEEILRYTREHNIVPNFTTSGFGLTDEHVELCNKYCGAVAVSWYNYEHTTSAINMLVNAGVTTNIHYVLGNNSIDTAIENLKNKSGFGEGINAVIFLLHKPVGLGQSDNILQYDDPRVKEFFNLIDNNTYGFRIGFDSCTIPALLNFTHNLNRNSFDTCEAARWSMYITSDMKALPCSFDNQDQRYAVNIKDIGSIQAAWDSDKFNLIRDKFKSRCPNCKDRLDCLGGCPLMDSITLCDRNICV